MIEERVQNKSGPDPREWWDVNKSSGTLYRKLWAKTSETQARADVLVIPYCTA